VTVEVETILAGGVRDSWGILGLSNERHSRNAGTGRLHVFT